VRSPEWEAGVLAGTDSLGVGSLQGQFGTLQLSTGEGDPRVRVGQLAVSIGNPLGLGGATVSAGIVSQAARTLKSQDGPSIDNVIQSDVALNPGSAGGPMLDTRGKVIGITTTVVPGPAATSFAVAAATIEWVLSDIVQYGEVRRGSIGAAGATRIVPSTLHQLLAPGQKTAVEVVQVQSHGAAEQAGISTADLIIAMNGIPIHSMGDLFRQLSTTSTGTDASITVVRGDVVSNIDVFFA
jgi:S1-C subfamily serine protease